MIADKQLYRCVSCARRVQALAGASAGTTCGFCGGALDPVWGLGQLAAPRDDRDERVGEALPRGAPEEDEHAPPITG